MCSGNVHSSKLEQRKHTDSITWITSGVLPQFEREQAAHRPWAGKSCPSGSRKKQKEGQDERPRAALPPFVYLVLHEQNEPRHHNVDCIPQARILEQFGNLTSRETRKEQS